MHPIAPPPQLRPPRTLGVFHLAPLPPMPLPLIPLSHLSHLTHPARRRPRSPAPAWATGTSSTRPGARRPTSCSPCLQDRAPSLLPCVLQPLEASSVNRVWELIIGRCPLYSRCPAVPGLTPPCRCCCPPRATTRPLMPRPMTRTVHLEIPPRARMNPVHLEIPPRARGSSTGTSWRPPPCRRPSS